MSNTLFEYLCAKYVKGANQSKRYISRLTTLFLWTNIVGLSARNSAEKRGIGVQKTWLWAAKLQGGAPDSVRSARLVRGELVALGIRRRRMTIIHRIVRWCTGLSGEPTVASSTVGHAICGWRVARSNGRLGTPDSVRCANRPRGPTVGCAWFGRRSRTGQLQWLSGGAPDCPVHHLTEGKFGLPS
jgi:hypothetical protein